MRRHCNAVLPTALLLAASAAAAQPVSSPPSDAQVKARVDALLGQMTLEDKVGQLSQAAGISFGGAAAGWAPARGAPIRIPASKEAVE